MSVGSNSPSRLFIFAISNGLSHLNALAFFQCILHTLTPSTGNMLIIVYLFSFPESEFNDGSSGSPHPNQSPNLIVPLLGLPSRLYPNVTHQSLYDFNFNILAIWKLKEHQILQSKNKWKTNKLWVKRKKFSNSPWIRTLFAINPYLSN